MELLLTMFFASTLIFFFMQALKKRTNVVADQWQPIS